MSVETPYRQIVGSTRTNNVIIEYTFNVISQYPLEITNFWMKNNREAMVKAARWRQLVVLEDINHLDDGRLSEYSKYKPYECHNWGSGPLNSTGQHGHFF